ncbi:GNAT family N-acetyltransferase [Amycolatopsis samaneae]|uniref:GNAT family N-acetyltransferase n=1 Tax=Amycolatopsis samaneae TaxID=664691 RepID=A0ABW5G6X4_9PSEU
MSDAAVRPATVQDVAEIARIQRETWRAAYTAILGEHAVATLVGADLEGTWRETIGYPGTRVHLATEGNFTVGFCVAGRAPDSEVAAADGTLPADAAATGLVAALLVEPRWGRRGHAGRLLATAAAGLRADGAERGVAWVPQADHASLGFYRRAGWAPDGTVRTLDTGETMVREIRLTGTLDLALR